MNKQTVVAPLAEILSLELPGGLGTVDIASSLSFGDLATFMPQKSSTRIRLCMMTEGHELFFILGKLEEPWDLKRYRPQDVTILYDSEQPQRAPHGWGTLPPKQDARQ